MPSAKPLPFLTDNDINRFWEKVSVTENEDECWNWEGSTCYGYGHFGIMGSIYKAHRVAFFLHSGVDPKEFMVCHTCDNRICCNPDHHFLGTAKSNSEDMHSKGRAAKRFGEKHHSHINPSCMARGEDNGLAKLNEKQVLEMRGMYANSKITYKKLGDLFGIDISVARRIIIRELWKHI